MSERDLTFQRSGELDVTQILGNTDAGIDFVDRVTHEEMTVVDAGRIIVPTPTAEVLQIGAAAAGLTFDEETVL